MEMWQDDSHDWRVVVEGCRLFTKDRQKRQGKDITLYASDHLECMELLLGDG